MNIFVKYGCGSLCFQSSVKLFILQYNLWGTSSLLTKLKPLVVFLDKNLASAKTATRFFIVPWVYCVLRCFKRHTHLFFHKLTWFPIVWSKYHRDTVLEKTQFGHLNLQIWQHKNRNIWPKYKWITIWIQYSLYLYFFYTKKRNLHHLRPLARLASVEDLRW